MDPWAQLLSNKPLIAYKEYQVYPQNEDRCTKKFYSSVDSDQRTGYQINEEIKQADRCLPSVFI